MHWQKNMHNLMQEDMQENMQENTQENMQENMQEILKKYDKYDKVHILHIFEKYALATLLMSESRTSRLIQGVWIPDASHLSRLVNVHCALCTVHCALCFQVQGRLLT
jgi:hypothetical protein